MIKAVRALCAGLGILLPLSIASAEDAQFTMRVSLDTSATHVRTVNVGEYLKQVEAASGGRIKTQMFHSAQLYRDRDVAKALRQGNIEMAVPGTWVLSGFIPDTDYFLLPSMAGQSAEVTHKTSDGEVGKIVNAEIEKKLEAKVLGPWLDLGFNNEYSTKQADQRFRRSCRAETAQCRRCRAVAARQVLQRDPEHDGVARCAVGAVAGHVRCADLDQ